MKIEVTTNYTTTVLQTWEVPDDTDLDKILGLGLPADAVLIGETKPLLDDTYYSYYGEITEVRKIED